MRARWSAATIDTSSDSAKRPFRSWNLSDGPSISSATSTDALGPVPVPLNGAANARNARSPTGTGLLSAARNAGVVPAFTSASRARCAALLFGGRYPRRARTCSPGRFIRTSIFRNLPCHRLESL